MIDPMASKMIGQGPNQPIGPLLLEDHHLTEMLAHFDRERIPERVVHAHGWGAHGEFEATDDVSDICYSDVLKLGKKTKTFTRFSTVGGEKGSSDGARDPRGFATKFYTDEGILDWVFNNTPVFFIRNPVKFPYFIHTQKRDPRTGRKDATMFWDYLSNNPESLHQVMQLFSDRGTPASPRFMNGYSGHTFKWYNKNGDFVYVQIHLKTDVKTLTIEEASEKGKEDPDFAGKDLYDAIQRGDYPTWTCYVQTMTPEQAEKEKRFSIFDLTKVWPHKDYPLRKFGKLTLNRNPDNYFAEVEQAAFNPAHLPPGMEASADPVLQSRLFSYADTHRHRVGVNHMQIPVNCPINGAHNPFQRDGAMTVNGNYGGIPNYPTQFHPMNFPVKGARNEKHEKWVGEATAFHWDVTDADFEQPRLMYEMFKKTKQDDNYVHNVAIHLCAAKPEVQDKTFHMFGRASPELGDRIKQATLKLSPRN